MSIPAAPTLDDVRAAAVALKPYLSLPTPLVQSPSLDSYTPRKIWRALLPEIWFFGPTCVTLIALGYVL